MKSRHPEESMKTELISLVSITAVFTCWCAKVPESTGFKHGKLAECPGKPNCVSSMAKDETQYIKPFLYSTDFNKAKDALLESVRKMKRSKIISDSGNYIHAEFRSKIFGFTDDVEFLIDEKAKTIHVRSASRVGYSDMGVNRKRVEILRRIFNARMR